MYKKLITSISTSRLLREEETCKHTKVLNIDIRV